MLTDVILWNRNAALLYFYVTVVRQVALVVWAKALPKLLWELKATRLATTTSILSILCTLASNQYPNARTSLY